MASFAYTNRLLRRSVLSRRVLTAGGLLLVMLSYTIITILTALPVFAANGNLVPNGDYSVNWAGNGGTDDGTCAGGTRCDYTDEGAAANTTDYIRTGGTSLSGVDGDTAEFDVGTFPSVANVSNVTIWVYAQSATNANGGTLDNVNINAFMGGTYQTAVARTPAYLTWGWHSASFSGSWSQADLDNLRTQLVWSVQGGGNPGNQRDDIRVSSVYAEITYTQSITYEQAAYRWFDNADSTNVDTPLAAQDAAATAPEQGIPFRLRMLMHVGSAQLGSGAQQFKLQYATRSGTCDTGFSGETYADVSAASGPIRYYNNPVPADGAAVTASANDPVHSTDTVVAQTYEEANNFTTATAIPAGQDGLWDFTLVDNNAPANSTYCFRIITSSGQTLSTYSAVPQITTQATMIDQSAYRWFENKDTVPGFEAVYPDPTASSDILNATATDDNYVYAAGYCTGCGPTGGSAGWIEKRDITTGALVTEFDGDGRVFSDPTTTTDQFSAISIDGSYIYTAGYCIGCGTVGNRGGWIEKRDITTGALVTEFDGDGRVFSDPNVGHDQFSAISIDNNYIYTAGCYNFCGSDSAGWIEKRDIVTGGLVTAFGTGGLISSDTGGGGSDNFSAITVDGSYIYVAGTGNYTGWIEKRDIVTGGLVNAFGTGGSIFAGAAAGSDGFNTITIDDSYVYTAGWYDNFGTFTDGTGWIEKRDITTGGLVTAFDGDGIIRPNASIYSDSFNTITIDDSYVYTAGICYTACGSAGGPAGWIEKRDIVTGALVTEFGTAGQVFPDPTASSDQYNAITMGTGYIYIAGNCATGCGAAGGSAGWIEKRDIVTGGLGGINDVGSPLAAQNTLTHLISPTQKYRLRMGLHVGGSQLKQNGQQFKLQYALRGADNVCDPGFAGETYQDVNTDNVGTSSIKSPTAAVNDSSAGGTIAWSSPGNVYASDNSRSTAMLNDGEATHLLKATGFNFTVPADATISGIKARVEKREDMGAIADKDVKIIKNNVVGATNKAAAGTGWPGGDSYAAYGSSTDLWGEVWTPADINTGNFGLAISAFNNATTGMQVGAYIDHIEITVYYSTTSTDKVRFYNNTLAANGVPLASNASDPIHSGHTNKPQTYQESNNFTNSILAVGAGKEGLWDFALQVSNPTVRTAYCFRAVKADGSLLDSYSVIPQLITGPAPQQLMRSGMWWADASEQPLAL